MPSNDAWHRPRVKRWACWTCMAYMFVEMTPADEMMSYIRRNGVPCPVCGDHLNTSPFPDEPEQQPDVEEA